MQMTSKRNLGPVLALVGAGIAVAATVAGFIAVGGPGDARERRLDEMTMNRITRFVSIANCAYNATGVVPATVEDAAHALSPGIANEPPARCGDVMDGVTTSATDQPTAIGHVTYRPVDASHIRVCGNFRRPAVASRQPDYSVDPRWRSYPPLGEDRPAGIHCFDVEMLKAANPARLPASHTGHMDVFE
jgi:hypothetical protein